MPGNSFGEIFRVTTFGESHGLALGGIIDGCPPGMELSERDLSEDIERRKTGKSKLTSQRQEPDQVQILSGVFEGKTTGTPIGLLIWNEDHKSKDYNDIKDLFRPGHADFTYHHKYGIRDYRGSGRASARETVIRVAAGAIAKKYLREHCGIEIIGHLTQVGTLTNLSDPQSLEDYIQALRKAGDSVGAQVRVMAKNVPIGLGEPVFDRLDADLAKAMMSINAVKAVGIGDGFAVVTQKGSEHRDEMDKSGFLSNHAGGILGGISSGQDIIIDVAFKPTSSIVKPGRTIDIHGAEVEVVTKGRHDPCVGIRAVPICEAMAALTLMDHLLRYRALGVKG